MRITLAVVCGSAPGDMNTALWRSGDVIFGYVWLSLELTKQLEELDDLINMTLRR
ncbi:hypothetical protein [Yersinia bercovieri]|uniref:hypothetical protein n=1 Tax=Yersinia bercovieri TaxID=634 RepID=UPI001C957CFB|nr:hypothetical protein [Yersinia bercovieri]